MAGWDHATTFAHVWSRSVALHNHETFLLFEVPRFSRDFCWPARLVDISGGGLAMKLPPERLDIDVGAPTYLSMLFDDRIRFDRVPATFVRLEGDVGAVEFGTWPEEDRLKLLDLLLDDPVHALPAAP